METKHIISFYDIMNTPQSNNVVNQFDEKIRESRRLINENKVAVDVYKIYFQNGFQQCVEYTNKIKMLDNIPSTSETENQKSIWMNEANQIWSCINQKCGQILASIRMNIKFLKDAERILIDNCLTKWKYSQILAGYGDVNKKSQLNLYDKYPQLYLALDNIQKQFEEIFECVINTSTLLDIIRNCYNQANYVDTFEAEASREITIMLKNIIWSSFIIDDQPPQVIKKDTR